MMEEQLLRGRLKRFSFYSVEYLGVMTVADATESSDFIYAHLHRNHELAVVPVSVQSNRVKISIPSEFPSF
jgi:hypothetical protein